MSAIAVIVNLNNRPVVEYDMQRMLDTLEHRGTDDLGIRTEGNVAMGHRMRWVTPESIQEQLPMASSESSLIITCDARIDNRRELIGQLNFVNKADKQIADSEIILRAYEKWGEDCVGKLLGDFVFAIWDIRAQKLFCGRDSMGVKHFYFYHQPGKFFVLASEIKALFSVEDVPKELNEAHIGDILILNYNDKEATPYKGIKRVPANNALAVDRNGLRMWQYWRPTRVHPRLFKSDREYEEEFREIFTEAVGCRLRSSYAVGSMLSGGLDSSAISCVASRHLSKAGKPALETFSAVFPSIAEIDSRIDERQFIDSVVRHIDCVPNAVIADDFNPFVDREKMQWHADHPIGVPNVFMDWALFKAAGRKDVRVLLSGFDGDSTVSYGYEALADMARRGNWLRMVKDAVSLNKNMPCRQHGLKKLLWNRGIEPAVPEVLRQAKRVLGGRPRKLPDVNILPAAHRFSLASINPAFSESNDVEGRYFDTVRANHPEETDVLTDSWNGLCNGLFSFALETFEKTSAAFAVEPRFPFFDRRLIEFCLSLPPKQRLNQGWTRSIFRRAMTGILPAEVQWRTDKANIGLSFKINLLKYARQDIEGTIFEHPARLQKYVDIGRLTSAYRRFESDPTKFESEPMFIMSSVYLSTWLKSAIKSEPARRAIP